MYGVKPLETPSASSVASLMTLIMLYDVGAYVAMLAHGGLPALLAMADGHVSH